MAADSLSTLEAELVTVEAAIAKAYAAPDFSTSAAGGGSLSVNRGNQIAALEKRRLYLRRRISALGGNLEAAQPARQGIDTALPAGNGEYP